MYLATTFDWVGAANVVVALATIVIGSPLFLWLLHKAGLAKDAREEAALQTAAQQIVALIEAQSRLDGADGRAKLAAAFAKLQERFPQLREEKLRGQLEMAVAELGHGIARVTDSAPTQALPDSQIDDFGTTN